MQIPENEKAQGDVAEAKTLTRPVAHPSANYVVDKRGAALLAKKKQRRAAHRVTLRRSHTKG